VHPNGFVEITDAMIPEKAVTSAIGATSSLTAVLVLFLMTKSAIFRFSCPFWGQKEVVRVYQRISGRGMNDRKSTNIF
jgi:hypothetical protein